MANGNTIDKLMGGDVPRDHDDPPPGAAVDSSPPSLPDQASSAPPRSILSKLLAATPSKATRLVARFYRNLGHPTNRDLKKVLAENGANHAVLKVIDDFVCPTCSKLAPPPQATKVALRTTCTFNERLLAATIWLQMQGRPVPVVTMLDAGTKFLAARMLKKETTQDFVHAVERGWVRRFGPPTALHIDFHRVWSSDAFRDDVTEHDVELIISPGEANNRLAQLERRHHVLRRSIEIYMADHQMDNLDGFKEALTYVIPQINSTLSVGGFSPTQWVIGHLPHLPGSLLDSHVNISHLSPSEAAGVGPRVRWKGPATGNCGLDRT